jgi:tetratricopeptide (TPR) repeat protein
MRFTLQFAIRNPQFPAWALFLCLLPGLSAQGRFDSYSIYGRVAQPDGSPAPRAVVHLSTPIGFNREVLADDAGRYEIANLRRDRYYLTAENRSAPDQVVDPISVEISLTSPNTISVNIYLRNKDTKAAPQEKQPAVVSVAEEKQDAPKPARKAFEQAMKLRNDKNYDESLKTFTRSIELFPSYFQALAERGHLLLTMGKVPEAMMDFQRALELNAHFGPALRGSGLGKFQQNKYAEAVQDLERAADLEPGNATDYYFKGIAEVALDRREPARASLQKALSIDPVSSVRAHVHLATLFIRENHPQEAIQELELYLKAVPNPPDKEKLNVILSQLRAGPRPR